MILILILVAKRTIGFDWDEQGNVNGIYLGLLGTKLLDLNFGKTEPQYPDVAVDPIYVSDPGVSGSVSFPGFNAYGPQVDLPETNLNYPEAQVGLPSADVHVGPITSDWP